MIGAVTHTWKQLLNVVGLIQSQPEGYMVGAQCLDRTREPTDSFEAYLMNN